MARVVGACARHNRQAARNDLAGVFDDAQMLLVVQGAGLPRRTADDDSVCAARDLFFQQRAQHREIHRAIRKHRCD